MSEPEPQPDERQELIIFLKSGQTVHTDVSEAWVTCDNLGEIIKLYWTPDPQAGHNRMLGVSPSEIAAVLLRPSPHRLDGDDVKVVRALAANARKIAAAWAALPKSERNIIGDQLGHDVLANALDDLCAAVTR